MFFDGLELPALINAQIAAPAPGYLVYRVTSRTAA